MATQTDRLPEPAFQNESSESEEEVIPNRAPITTGPSKTFPMASRKCAGKCHNTPTNVTIIPVTSKTPRISRVQWRGIDEAIQTEEIESAPLETSGEEKRVTVMSNTRKSERAQSGALGNATKSSAPTKSSSRTAAQYKSFDEGRSQASTSYMERESKNLEISNSPTREAPFPPRCPQCDCEIDHTAQSPEEVQSPLDPGYDIRFPSHICTARSSIQCQQCFPSRQPSALSPLPFASPATPYQSPLRSAQKPSSPIRQESVPVKHVEVESPHSPQEKITRTQFVVEIVPEYYEEPAITVPVKRPTLPRLKPRPVPSRATPKEKRRTPVAPRVKNVPQVPQPPTLFTTAVPFDISSTLTSLDSYSRQLTDVSDKAVFRGLHVATAAACDEDVDRWIEDITGFGVRQFLAKLSRFDGLGHSALAGVAKRAAKQRRNEARGWEVLRELRIREQKIASSKEQMGTVQEADRDEDRDPMDDTVGVKRSRDKRTEGQPDPIQGMRHTRECKGSEGIRDRAVGMGWRDRSVSGV